MSQKAASVSGAERTRERSNPRTVESQDTAGIERDRHFGTEDGGDERTEGGERGVRDRRRDRTAGEAGSVSVSDDGARLPPAGRF